MWSKCESCGEDGVLFNEEQRCDVCCYCGVVSDGNLVSGLDVAVNESLGQFCNETTVTKFQVKNNGFRRNLTTCTSNSKMSRTAKGGLECLDYMMTSYSLPMAAQEEAIRLYKDCFLKRYHLKEARALAGAVVIAVLRREKRVVTFKEIAEVCESPIRNLGRQFKLVTKNLQEKGDLNPQHQTPSESVQNALTFFLTKLPRDQNLKVSEVSRRAAEISDWIDVCSDIPKRPPHLYALTVCFIAFKMVNMSGNFNLTLQEFNERFEFVPPQLLLFPSYQKVFPNSIIQCMCNIVNKKTGPSLRITPATIFFMLDMVLELRPFLELKVTEEMMSIDGDVAFENFKRFKETEELTDLNEVYCKVDHIHIADSEVEEYILSDKEVELRRAIFRDKLDEANKKRNEAQ